MLVTGVDIIELERIQRTLARWGERFLRRVYTDQELAYCHGRVPQLAARFAAKEAAMKALGTGRVGMSWRDVEVVREHGGVPRLALHGRAEARARAIGLVELSLSLSHSHDYAIALVVGRTEP